MAFEFFEDFKVKDGKIHSYQIDIENHSSYSHGHAGIYEDGEYRITLDGNKHFLNTPPLKDFHLEMKMDLVLHNIAFGYGFKWYFRYDRTLMQGHVLEMHLDQAHNMEILLDGKSLLKKSFKKMPPVKNMKVALDVKGSTLAFTVFGNTCKGKIGKKDLPGKGEVGFDMLFSPGSTARIREIKLVSPDPCKEKRIGIPLSFTLSGVHGMTEPLQYTMDVFSFGNGYARIECVMGGTIRGRGDRDDGGTKGWIYEYEFLTDPYIRIESNGKEFLHIYFFRGEMVILDRDWKAYANRKFENLSWPMKFSLVCRNFPEKYTVAAGYGYVRHKPWLFCENGPWEQIRNEKNEWIYEGPSLRKERVALLVKSPEDKKIVERIPKHIPEYEKALQHAKTQHYFYDDEKISFLLTAHFRKDLYEAEEFIIQCEVQDPYGNVIENVKGSLKDAVVPAIEKSFGSMAKRFTLDKPLPSGVYHLKLLLQNGTRRFFDDVEIFEVLPEDPDGLPPPLASGLPMMISMNNEIKNLESDAFDPLNSWGGMGHYYTLVMRYPYIAKRLKIWEILKIYHRKWHLMLTRRNAGDFSLENESNREMIRHADFLDKDVPEWESHIGSLFLFRRECHGRFVLNLLKEFLLKTKKKLRFTTPEILDQMLKEDPAELTGAFEHKGNHLSLEQFDELVNTCWNEWVHFAAKAFKKRSIEFGQELLAINPKIGRGSYGPSSLYVQNYKSAYGARLAFRFYECDEATNANDSYFFIEEYHLSCDYTIVRSSYFIANCKLMTEGLRRLFPEIYYGGGLGCNDGAVSQAHPPFGIYNCLPQHQRSIVYTFGYATPYFKKGRFDYWRDYGFHCPTPDKASFREFIKAWGDLRKSPPAKQLSAPFFCYDFSLFELLGDHHETECNFSPAPGFTEGWTDVINTGEEAMGYAFIELTHNGYNTPVQTTFDELVHLDKKQCPFIVIPPLPAGTPEKILKKIRNAHKKGINILAFEFVEGLEDLFGVEKRKKSVPLRRIGNETFKHKKANAFYKAKGADTVMYGAEFPEGKENIPVLFSHKTKWGKTVFFNVPPTSVRREDYRVKLGCGQATISEAMHKGMIFAASFLMPEPEVKSEWGMINGCVAENGDVIVTVCGCTAAYGVTDNYPKSYRFKVSYPGIGKARIESRESFAVTEKKKDSLIIRSETELDAGSFFRFILK